VVRPATCFVRRDLGQAPLGSSGRAWIDAEMRSCPLRCDGDLTIGPGRVAVRRLYSHHMGEPTHYEALMLHPTATMDVINAAYRALAKRYHPDLAGADASPTMARINEAYAVLSDEQKRARYDEGLGQPKRSAPGQAPAPTRTTMPGAASMKYDAGQWSVRSPDEPTPPPSPYGDAGPPPAFPAARGSILSFGRYRGWSLTQVAAHDRDYLEWLRRTMAGRTYAAELAQVLGH
jgi:DnaJ-domain-containing protein 1